MLEVREAVEILDRVGIQVVAAALVDAGQVPPAGSEVAASITTRSGRVVVDRL